MDGDPHFVVDFPLSKLTVCFNIDGEPGDILRLVSDHLNSGKFCLPLWSQDKEGGCFILCAEDEWPVIERRRSLNGQLQKRDSLDAQWAPMIGKGTVQSFWTHIRARYFILLVWP